jgi:UDP-N-acetylglucosamine 1-carboxyvinyltransferase
MDKLKITGPNKLSGIVKISRAKNAYLPILAAVLLSDKPIHLKNIPDLQDIKTMIKLLTKLGVDVVVNGNVTTFNAKNLNSHEATYELVKTMRASIFVLGPLLARLKKAKVSLPGGCAIGTRPIDIHLVNLEKMGATIELNSGYVEAYAPNFKPVHLTLSFPSVGATENLMMAAVFTKGETIIENAALEPEIDDLANFLNAMGAKVSGIGTSKIHVQGVDSLNEVTYEAIGDRIEASTYLMAALATNSKIEITDFNPHHIEFVIDTLTKMGAKIEMKPNGLIVYEHNGLKGCNVDTAPFPGFPTDAQAQLLALCTLINSGSIITENIFENRFMHVPELVRLGADITLKGNSAFVSGGKPLKAAPVMCTDLRASAALVIAALAAEGVTDVQRVYHLDRGYERLEEKLKLLGAKIERMKE